MGRKKISLIVIGICIFTLSIIGVSYAFWEFRSSQTGIDSIASSCFQVTLTDEKNPISLPKAYPITDEEGHDLTPYEFTITNVCSTSLTYQVNLETLSLEADQKPTPEEYIKVQLDDRTPTILTHYESVTHSLDNATSSHRLTTGILDGNHKSVTYRLRLWLDEETPPVDTVMNSHFKSKITVVATYKTNEQLKNTITLSSKSNTEGYNEESESITLTAISDKYPLTEYKISERQETQNWKPINDKDTTFTITEEFKRIGKYYFAVRDEVGNEQEQEFEVTKVDTSGPDIKYEQIDNHTSVELTIKIKDTQSGLVKYQITKEDLSPIALLSESTPEAPNEWEEIPNTKEDFTITKTIEDNGVYYIFAQDALGHISSMKYSTEMIDKDPPTIELSSELNTWGASDKIHISLSDEKAGLFGYKVTTTEETPNEWETITGNLKETNIEYEVHENGTYYIYAKDAYNNISHNSISINWIDTNSPVANLTLSLDGKNIIANASGSTDTESNIASYEYKLDDSEEWINGSSTYSLTVPKYGRTYEVTVRVKDAAGNANEISETIYMKGLATDVIKDVDVVTIGNGLYSVKHDDAEITWTGTTEQVANLKKEELRYAGTGINNKFDLNDYVHNYVDIDGQIWRIIGLVNTPEGQRIKLVTNNAVGEYTEGNWKGDEIGLSWDTSASNVNGGDGVNEWSQSDLMKLLNPGYETNPLETSDGTIQPGQYVNNSLYWTGGTGKCYTQSDNDVTDCDFATHKMPDSLKSMIDTITWNTGSNEEDDMNMLDWDPGFATNIFYSMERSNNTVISCEEAYMPGICDDEVERTTSWQGKVGLMYPSDYGYATSGGTLGREACLAKNLFKWSEEEYKNQCGYNDWLFFGDLYTNWALFPSNYLGIGGLAITSSVGISTGFSGMPYYVFPSVYLLPSVKIVGGTGAYDDMYQLSL